MLIPFIFNIKYSYTYMSIALLIVSDLIQWNNISFVIWNNWLNQWNKKYPFLIPMQVKIERC